MKLFAFNEALTTNDCNSFGNVRCRAQYFVDIYGEWNKEQLIITFPNRGNIFRINYTLRIRIPGLPLRDRFELALFRHLAWIAKKLLKSGIISVLGTDGRGYRGKIQKIVDTTMSQSN
jgi:hypothetical protein